MGLKQTLTFVSHTHWDREWYQPFEEFRLRLVKLVDKLLYILDTDPGYKYFMLDGQTIVLDDYLAIRPENRQKIEDYVQSGRIQIGPWYILPDEFLVSGESTIRNLLVGAQMCEDFGMRMDVGNIPDPFGHISQLPQILRGFDIDSVVFTRGVSGTQNEFTWLAPDGTDILVIHQQHGYGNATNMPNDEQMFIERTKRIIDGLVPTATTPHLLAMNGTDHVEPMPELSRLLATADAVLEDVDIQHGTLPQFIAAVRADEPQLETRIGEMRDSAKSPLLPGVLSTRMWIKQRNAACETLLTRWVEPMTAFAEIINPSLSQGGGSASLVKQAWRYLLQNHPHDSICGCSVDQVHKEMDVRFDWVNQIGAMLTQTYMEQMTAVVDTSHTHHQSAVVVYNPVTHQQTGLVSTSVPVPEDVVQFVLVSNEGDKIQPQVTKREREVMWEFTASAAEFTPRVGQMPFEINGAGMQSIKMDVTDALLNLEILLLRDQPPNIEAIKEGQTKVLDSLQNDEITHVHLVIHYGDYATCSFVAPDVPGLGYRTFWVKPTQASADIVVKPEEPAIENEFFHIKVGEDGTFILRDKTTGKAYPGLNRFVDTGDRGDEYNYCPVENDLIVNTPAEKPQVRLAEYGPAQQTLEITMTYQVPASLGDKRSERSPELIDLPITTHISLIPGVRRVDVSTTVNNQAADHRLRVHFPVPAVVDTFDVEGHFDIVTRPLDLPTETEDWVEQPAGTHPQCAWAQLTDGKKGLMVANRGLPEVEAMRTDQGTELALTLLRSVGWLSRADMSVRRGHAGPGLPTVEAQCIGEYTFDYALIPLDGMTLDAMLQAQAFSVTMRAMATSIHAGQLPPTGHFVEVYPDDLIVTAVKKAESSRGMIVRFWNTKATETEAVISFWQRPAAVSLCNLGERFLSRLDIDHKGVIRVPVRGREIVTLLAEF